MSAPTSTEDPVSYEQLGVVFHDILNCVTELTRCFSQKASVSSLRQQLESFYAVVNVLEELTQSFHDANTQEMNQVLKVEIKALAQFLQGGATAKTMEQTVFPAIVSIAAALKTYVTAKKEILTLTTAPPVEKEKPELKKQDIKMCTSMLQQCAMLNVTLKGNTVDRSIALDKLQSIVEILKGLLQNAFIASEMGKKELDTLVKEIIELQSSKSNVLTRAQADKLAQGLLPIILAIKNAMDKYEKADKVRSQSQTSTAESLRRTESETQLDATSKRPMGFKHDAVTCNSHEQVNPTSRSYSMNSTNSLNVLDDSLDEISKNDKAFEVMSLDFLPPSSDKRKHMVNIQVLPKMLGYISAPILIHKSDLDIIKLSRDLNVAYPGLLAAVDISSSGQNAFANASAFSAYQTFFTELSKHSSVLKSDIIKAFVFPEGKTSMSNEIDNHVDHKVNRLSTFSRTSTALSRMSTISISAPAEQRELEAIFFSPYDSMNTHNVFEIDVKELENMTRSTSVASTTSASGVSTTSKRNSFLSSPLASGSTGDLTRTATLNKRESKLRFFTNRGSSFTDSVRSLSSLPSEDEVNLESSTPVVSPFMKFLESRPGYRQTSKDTISLMDGNGYECLTIKSIGGSPRVVAGSKDQILQFLFSEDVDPHLLSCFVATHRVFMNSQEFFGAIVAQFMEAGKKATNDVVQGRCIEVLRYWVTNYAADMQSSPELQNQLNTFLATLKNDSKHAIYARSIITSMDVKRNSEMNSSASSNSLSNNIVLTNKGIQNLAARNAMTVAEQLTRIDHEYLRKITALDLMNYLWTKDEQPSRIQDWVDYFNRISFWVGTELCVTPILKNRIEVLEQIIRLLKALKDLNNYNGMMAVISGINMASIRRLKKTWDGLSTKSAALMHELEKIMDPKSNYQSYRDVEVRFKGKTFVPFFGLYLKDLTFANDGNPKSLPNGLLNMSKSWAVWEIIQRFQGFQHAPAPVFMANDETYAYCKTLVALPERRLYSYSLVCEPRSAADGTNKERLIEKWSRGE